MDLVTHDRINLARVIDRLTSAYNFRNQSIIVMFVLFIYRATNTNIEYLENAYRLTYSFMSDLEYGAVLRLAVEI